jgi:hypothetical protein
MRQTAEALVGRNPLRTRKAEDRTAPSQNWGDDAREPPDGPDRT